MKSILLSTVFVIAGSGLFAQTLPVRQPLTINLNSIQANHSARYSNPEQLTFTPDTADEYIVRATSGTFYGAQGGGYVFGTSYFYDSTSGNNFPITEETGLEFDGVGNASVTDLLFWAGAKQITGTADDITAKVYDVGPDSMPTTLLGSGTMSMQDVDTGLTATFTDLAITGANITSSYFVSISYAGNDDTLGFVSTGVGDGMMEMRLRQKASPIFISGAWARMGDLYPFLDVDMFWAPVYTTTGTGIDNHFNLNNATLEAVYPTVANSEVHIDYTLATNSAVSYYLFDLRGKKYFEQKSEQQHQGFYSQAFDVSNLAGGNYFLSVTINGKTVTQKVVVAR